MRYRLKRKVGDKWEFIRPGPNIPYEFESYEGARAVLNCFYRHQLKAQEEKGAEVVVKVVPADEPEEL